MVLTRRAMGSLEWDVLGQLWDAEDAVTPAEVRSGLDGDLAYTTVMTVLTRLWRKGRVGRERSGRSYRYSPLFSEAELLAERMDDELRKGGDHSPVLSHFVGSLSDDDAVELRKLLDEMDT